MPHEVGLIDHAATRLWTAEEDWDGNSQGWGVNFS